MNNSPSVFNNVTLLVTHYNRSKSLERLLSTFKHQNIIFGEIIVSDDGSQPEHVNYIRSLQQDLNFTLLTTPQNKGLANNINKGQDAVKTPYTLYVQEDFVPLDAFLEHFKGALSIMEKETSMDLVRFYAYEAYPYKKPYAKGFSEMICKLFFLKTGKIYQYSDHPHLRRSSFFEKFGRYKEGIKSDKAEYLMCVSFIQNKGKGLFFNDYKNLFDQKNSSDEPSTVQRVNWTQSGNILIATVRNIYRLIKYNYHLYFAPKLFDNRKKV
jgi:glycosyltransferase involved in cell wall biosynthesis